MPIGGSKSLLFIVLAIYRRDSLTVVIILVIVLREDLKARCNKVGISYKEQNSKRVLGWVRVVLVTLEVVVKELFRRFIVEKKMIEQLDRIIINKCYIILEVSIEQRPKVIKLKYIIEVGCQLVYITAIILPRLEGRFLELARLKRERVTMFRQRISQKNIIYRVIQYKLEKEEEAVKGLVEAKLRQYIALGQIVVYGRIIK